MKPLEKLFSPISLGTMKLRNRIAMAPMATNYTNNDGTLSDQIKDYLLARAAGGVGMIIMEVTTIDSTYPYVPNTISLGDDKFVPGMKEFTDAVHAEGARIIPQVSHPGPESVCFLNGEQALGPSVVICHSHKQLCRELTVAEIKNIVVQYGEAARRAREGGCDGIELHAAHSYMLLGSFMSSLRNRRTDAYGGSIENRLRFPLEVLESVRARAGKDFPIVMRISGDELTPGGRDLRETEYIAPILAEAGVTAFHVSSGTFPQMSWRILPPSGTPRGLNVQFAEALKKVVDIPILVVGRINDARYAEYVLQRNQADVIVMGRALLADPELPKKAKEGRFDDIAPCAGCGLGCIAGREGGRDMSCVINPTVGREKEMVIKPAAKAKKVMVVGGGPAGMEAARVANLRGHKVTLYEKSDRLGGQLNLAAVPPMKQEITKFTRYLSYQLEKGGVAVNLNTEVTPALVDEVKPDAIVIATGGEALVPNVPGIKGPKVVSAHDVLASKVTVPNGNVLVIGGGMVGLEVAEFLACPDDNPVVGNTNVTVIEMLPKVGMDMVPEGRTLLMQRLHEAGVQIRKSSKVKEILDDGARIVNTIMELKPDWTVVYNEGDKVEEIRGMDTIIIAMGAKSVEDLSDKLNGRVPEVYVIGDARSPRKALEAVTEGAEVGRQI